MNKDEALKLAVQQVEVAAEYIDHLGGESGMYRAALTGLKKALAQPPLTRPANSQDWAGMDGATAFHLIERHSDNWSDASMMMDEWRVANPTAQPDNTAKLYEELRLIIDGGSESFTHIDAVQYLKDTLRQKEWTPEDMAHRPGGLAQPDQDQTEIAFKAWWQAHGQYCRAGGGDYEKTFAYRAWMASLAIPEKPKHPEQMARLGWQYVECPACGSEGARAFPKPEEQPVAWQVMAEDEAMKEFSIKDMAYDWCIQQKLLGSIYVYWLRPLYTSPPKRQPLTQPEKQRLWNDARHENQQSIDDAAMDYGTAIEAAHGIGDKT